MRKLQRLLACLCVLVLCCSGLAFAEGQQPPDGQAPPSGENGQPPALPDGQTPPDGANGLPPEKPDGMPSEGGPGGGMPGGFGGSGAVTQGTAATLLEQDTSVTDESYASENADENALRVSGAVDVTLTNVTLAKAGDTSNTEDSDFYGQNAALLATDGASVSITGSSIRTDASGGNAVFSYGTADVTLTGTVIRTSKSNSGGIHVAGGGSLTVTNLDVETQGNSAAAIRSDRGGGTLLATGGQYITNGTGSPAIYCTADIAVTGATLTANHSEAVVVEGQNSVTLTGCTVSGSMDGTYADANNENLHAVMIYQSMSGDADVGQSHFGMTGGSLTSLNGDLIYITNTSCTLSLTGVALTYANENLLQVVGNDSARSWGQSGANGGVCAFTTKRQMMAGVITVDALSSLDMSLTEESAFTGTVNPGGQAGIVNVTLDVTSTWSLTADAYITSFTGDLAQVTTNGYTLHIANE